jgi:hypothetical protein
LAYLITNLMQLPINIMGPDAYLNQVVLMLMV